MKYLIFDTETTGLPNNFNAPFSDSDNWPRMVQLAWQLHDSKGELISNNNYIIKPEGYTIPFNSYLIHGISTEKAIEEGKDLSEVLETFNQLLDEETVIIGHNIEFDINIVGAEFFRKNMDTKVLSERYTIDTKEESTDYCQIPGGRGGRFKWPNLSELHKKLFQNPFDEAHNAAADVNATARCFFELVRLGVIPSTKAKFSIDNFTKFKDIFSDVIQPYNIEVGTQIAEKDTVEFKDLYLRTADEIDKKIDSPFFHFHNHTSFSILSATSRVDELVEKAVEENMPAVGITDSGNMMGAFQFINAIKKVNQKRNEENDKIKEDLNLKVEHKPIVPIIGCEVYVSDRYKQLKFTKNSPDKRFTQVLLAKNKNGYHNLSKISSTGYIDGYYSGYPRVGKEVILEYKEDIIATTGSISGEIPNLILNVGEHQAEEAFVWWKENFGDDFYVELIRHGLEEEEYVNQVLIRFAKKYNVKVLAQNNTFYLNQNDSEGQDILLCVRDGEKKDTPVGRGRGFRFGFPNKEFYFKSQAQMGKLFEDIPESIYNFSDFIKNFEFYDLKQNVLLPKFDIPEEFIDPKDEEDDGVRGENAYLRHLAYEGAKERYDEITEEVSNRLDFELETIQNIGYPGYFLIVQDFTSQARKMGISVGPGRGSAAGSAVAYCIGITNIDPIKYDLLFERFLNPDRVSLPDIDIDFDDRGRDEIISWVIDKYGKEQVAQIITYGTMAGKSAIRDAARVLDLPLDTTGIIAGKVHTKLNKLLGMKEEEINNKFSGDELNDAYYLLETSEEDTLEGEVVRQAKVIEGSIRNTGVHACGVIITPKNLMELVPLAVAKEKDKDAAGVSQMVVTQFDNAVVENAGLLKMDFLGLKTLTIIKDAIELIKESKGVELVPDEFPLDDEKTYKEIFQKGRTVGIFQFESSGMQKHLKSLQPDKFDDLIAMNALYRPGPMQYIPNFVKRKHGKEVIVYDLPEMEEFLSETYGITVYQEQVMLLSQKLANFTKGEADVLRKAMGKKLLGPLAELEPKFKKQAMDNGHPEKVIDKIWNDWIAFTQYAFNKSHSTCYTFVAFQTAYLKAHYPAEFMAAVLSNNMKNLKDVGNFMNECKRMGIEVLSPDVNESSLNFSVNSRGAIRFALNAIKGVGQGAVDYIVQERIENGKYKGIFNFVQRVDLRQCNKKTMEGLILAGAFDEFDKYHRGQYFYDLTGVSNLEKILKFGQALQEGGDDNQLSMFDTASMEMTLQEPFIDDCEEWPLIQKLNKEKEVVGIYISSHPLDKYKYEIKFFQDVELTDLKANENKYIEKTFTVAGMISDASHAISRNGNDYGRFTLDDYTDSFEFTLFGEDYLKNKHFLVPNQFVMVRVNISKNKYSERVYTNVKNIELLENVLENNAKGIKISIDLDLLDDELLQSLFKLIDKNKGDKALKIEFRYGDNKSRFTSDSKKMRVEIKRELLEKINFLEGLDFSLN